MSTGGGSYKGARPDSAPTRSRGAAAYGCYLGRRRGAHQYPRRGVTTVQIDVWDTGTFDQELISKLRENTQLVRDYLTTDRRLFEEREASDHRMPHATNPYGGDYQAFVEQIGREIMQVRPIRAWHYKRLVDAEVSAIRRIGIYPSTLETLRRRLDAQVTAKAFSTADADALYAASPFHEQEEIRSGRFWMTSDPIRLDNRGVELLLGNWGGEATYFWLENERLKKLVAGIGCPRILEIAVPVSKTREWLSAGRAVAAAFARTLGCRPDRGAFDLCSMTSLGPEAVIAIHSEGGAKFASMARGYPVGFVLGDAA